MNPKRLLRLFPGLWRLRYGAEFLALLESAPITRAVVIDVARAAGREWLARTRVGRVVLGVVVAQAAYMCAVGAAWVLSPRWFLEPFRLDSLSSLVIALLSVGAPVWVASLLIIAKTRRDRRYAELGLRYQLAALFLSALWAEWTGLAYRFVGEAGPHIRWDAFSGNALTVVWMLLLLLNVDRRREAVSPWHESGTPEKKVSRLGSLGLRSDRY